MYLPRKSYLFNKKKLLKENQSQTFQEAVPRTIQQRTILICHHIMQFWPFSTLKKITHKNFIVHMQAVVAMTECFSGALMLLCCVKFKDRFVKSSNIYLPRDHIIQIFLVFLQNGIVAKQVNNLYHFSISMQCTSFHSIGSMCQCVGVSFWF